ncbi:MAG: hypothetical protein WCP21_17990, partial [Armatimonadota bacterium]
LHRRQPHSHLHDDQLTLKALPPYSDTVQSTLLKSVQGECVAASALEGPDQRRGASASWLSYLWWFVTFHFVCFGWLLFACPLGDAGMIIRRMLGLG